MDCKEVWGCFLVSGVRMLHFLKDLWKFIQIHQYYTMALICGVYRPVIMFKEQFETW